MNATGIEIRRARGSIFQDLGFGPEEAESLRIRSELMVQIRLLIEGRKLTQTAAARLFGVTQPGISDLMAGKIELFSIDTLVGMLARARVKVQLRVRRSGQREAA